MSIRLHILTVIYLSWCVVHRETDHFPIRELTFSCTDVEISYAPGHSTYSSFAYDADVPYVAVIIVSFCLPPFVVSSLVV